MSALEKKMVAWIRGQLLAEEKADRFSLVAIGGSRNGRIWTEKVGEDCDPESVVTIVFQVAQQDADGMPNGGMQHYALLSQIEGEKESRSRFPFPIKGNSGETEIEGVYPSEDTSLRGQLQASMRHTEAIMRINSLMMSTAFSHMSRTIDSQAKRLDEMEYRRYQEMELVEKLMSAGHVRDLETKKLESWNKRADDLMEKVSVVWPIVLHKAGNWLAGGKVLPEKLDGKDSMLKAFLDSLSQEQLDKLLEGLKPEQGLAVLELFKMFGGYKQDANGAYRKKEEDKPAEKRGVVETGVDKRASGNGKS